mgnify:CR=1 FL=1
MLQVLQQALEESQIFKVLESVNVLTSCPPDGYRQGRFFPVKAGCTYSYLPALEHITYSAESQHVTLARFSSPTLISVHIPLSRGDYFGFFSESCAVPDDDSTKPLRNLVLSAYGIDINYRDLFKTLLEFEDRRSDGAVVDRLTIRGVSIHKSACWVRRFLPEKPHFKEIVFDNVYINSGSKSMPMPSECSVLPVFAERSDVIKSITGGEERILQRKDVFQEEADDMDVDEDEFDDDFLIDSDESDYESEGEDEDEEMMD